MKKCFCLLLACLLCLSVPDAFAEGAADPLEGAFGGTAAVVLEEETWPGLPDGKLGLKLAAGSSVGRRYEPRIVWHPDGTVVMLTEDDGIGFFTLAAR